MTRCYICGDAWNVDAAVQEQSAPIKIGAPEIEACHDRVGPSKLNAMESLEPYLALWGLRPDGAAFTSLNARLLPVRHGDEPAMLKIAKTIKEERGATILAWWGGEGAAQVLAHDGPALLIERAEGSGALAHLARLGQDEEATRILCAVAARLHAAPAKPPPGRPADYAMTTKPVREVFDEQCHLSALLYLCHLLWKRNTKGTVR